MPPPELIEGDDIRVEDIPAEEPADRIGGEEMCDSGLGLMTGAEPRTSGCDGATDGVGAGVGDLATTPAAVVGSIWVARSLLE